MSFNHVFKRIVKDSRPIMIMCGGHDKGKTDFSLYLANKGFKMGLLDEVGTNIKVFDDERFIPITSLPRLKSWLRSSTARKWFILDEAGLHAYRRNPLSRKNKALIGISFLIRKYYAKIMLITQRMQDLEGTFVSPDFVVAKFKKVTREYARFRTNLVEGGYGEIYPIPATKIKFDTRDVAPFTLEHNSTEVIKGRALCCQVARLFVKYGNYSLVGKELGIKHPQQVKRLLIEHLKHG